MLLTEPSQTLIAKSEAPPSPIRMQPDHPSPSMAHSSSLSLGSLFDSLEEGLHDFNTPKDADGIPVSAGPWMRVDGLSYIGSDTALYHIIAPLPLLAGSFSICKTRVTVIGQNGEVHIGTARDDTRETLLAAGYREGPVPSIFARDEKLVEPNPRGVTTSDLRALL